MNPYTKLLSMIKKIDISRQKLFDGDEAKGLKEIFEIGNQRISFIDFYNSPLRELKKEMDKESFDRMIEESGFNPMNGFLEKYLSEDGLEINYLKKNDIIYLFSYGEYQPGRYMLFLESMYLTLPNIEKMDKERFITKVQSRKACHYVYKENERNENTGLIEVWLHHHQIVLTWEECPEGLQYDESSYSKDEVHHFTNFEELDVFFNDHDILYINFLP